MDLKLNGKVALVLGASRGLGGAIAKMLAEEGASVIGVARNTSSIDEWSKTLSIKSYKCDLSNSTAVEDLIKFASKSSASLSFEVLVISILVVWDNILSVLIIWFFSDT